MGTTVLPSLSRLNPWQLDLSRCVASAVGAQTTVYVYDAFGSLSAAYSNGGMGTPPCHTCYFTYDHLGTTRMITDPNANVIARHDFLPFGEEIPGGVAGRSNKQFGPGLDNISQKFTGQERDSETLLDFFQARYFGGALGRFLSPDPKSAGATLMNPQTWNAYAYVGNNPLAATDPTGTELYAPALFSDDGGGDLWSGGGGPCFMCGGPPVASGSVLDQQEAANEAQYAANLQQTYTAIAVAEQANQAVANGNLQQAGQIAATNSNVALSYTPPDTPNPIYNTFAVAAAMLGIGPGQSVSVVAQQIGVSISVQLSPSPGAAPYQLGDLTIDPDVSGTSDPLTAWHGGNPSWYVGGDTDVTHIVNIVTPPSDPNDQFQTGLQFHIDSYNPMGSIVGFVGHVSTEVIPGANVSGPQSTYTCAVGSGCQQVTNSRP